VAVYNKKAPVHWSVKPPTDSVGGCWREIDERVDTTRKTIGRGRKKGVKLSVPFPNPKN